MKKIILIIAIFFVSISYGQLKQVKGNTFTSSACGAGGKSDISYPSYFTGNTSGYAGVSTSNKWEMNFNVDDLNELWIQAELIFETGIPENTSMANMLSISSNDYSLTAYAHNATGSSLTCNFSAGQINKIRLNLEYNGTYVWGTDVQFTITATDPSTGTSETINVNISPNNPTASIDKLEKYDFSFGPNPSENFIYLSSNKSIGDVEIYNLVGQKSLSSDISDTKGTLDISNLSIGVYIMNVTIDENIGTYKIIKQ